MCPVTQPLPTPLWRLLSRVSVEPNARVASWPSGTLAFCSPGDPALQTAFPPAQVAAAFPAWAGVAPRARRPQGARKEELT